MDLNYTRDSIVGLKIDSGGDVFTIIGRDGTTQYKVVYEENQYSSLLGDGLLDLINTKYWKIVGSTEITYELWQ